MCYQPRLLDQEVSTVIAFEIGVTNVSIRCNEQSSLVTVDDLPPAAWRRNDDRKTYEEIHQEA